MAKGGGNKGGTDARRAYLKKQNKRSYKEAEEIKDLQSIIDAGAPPRGSNPLTMEPSGAPGAAGSQYAGARTFDELPISQYTKEGLRHVNYVTLTAIQRAAIPHALCGRDILGAAKTGSGKTLTFLLPVRPRMAAAGCRPDARETSASAAACLQLAVWRGHKFAACIYASNRTGVLMWCTHAHVKHRCTAWPPTPCRWWSGCTARAGRGWTAWARSCSRPRASWPCRSSRSSKRCARCGAARHHAHIQWVSGLQAFRHSRAT